MWMDETRWWSDMTVETTDMYYDLMNEQICKDFKETKKYISVIIKPPSKAEHFWKAFHAITINSQRTLKTDAEAP